MNMNRSDEYFKLISMQPVIIKGEYEAKRIWLNDKEITSDQSKNVFDHSVSEFNWGDSGNGAAQLALAVLFELTADKKLSIILHHVFKNEFFSNLQKSDFDIKIDIGDWFYRNIHRSSMMPDF
jgi:hypothetical protein